ncbi:MAG TPA: type II secretion system inner membrane protein GspF [bacterium]|nr:type II secretion system inner membrane protein GspF [bacterium]HPO09827.1 type II secretion system inner membrane protein GspF [bacterium]HQP98871.1 type II secretion system inner membrane protein GspF [bacterium]
MRYSYKAKKNSGEVVQGYIEAENRRLVIGKLQKMQFFPISVVEEAGGKGLQAEFSLNTLRRVGLKDITTFSRQLSDLLKSGLPLAKSLEVLTKQTSNPKLLSILRTVCSDVQGGSTFADALKRHPKVFSDLYCSMVHAGEISGGLDAVMERLSNFLESEQETRSKFFTAMTYPAFMVVVCILVVIVLFTFVVPKFQTMFEESGAILPISTQFLMGVSRFIQLWWWVILGGFAALIVLFRHYIHTEVGRIQWDEFKLQVPLIGDLVKKREVSKFARTLGTLLANGVNILRALEITEEVVSNKIIAKNIREMAGNIKEGERLSARMAQSPHFPPLAVNMVAVGEETGDLEHTLNRVAQSYENETERAMKTVTTLLEPMMIVVMAMIVGFIVFAMIMPIFQISQSIQ